MPISPFAWHQLNTVKPQWYNHGWHEFQCNINSQYSPAKIHCVQYAKQWLFWTRCCAAVDHKNVQTTATAVAEPAEWPAQWDAEHLFERFERACACVFTPSRRSSLIIWERRKATKGISYSFQPQVNSLCLGTVCVLLIQISGDANILCNTAKFVSPRF